MVKAVSVVRDWSCGQFSQRVVYVTDVVKEWSRWSLYEEGSRCSVWCARDQGRQFTKGVV
jgi:hypothetical protein